eukprot:augustus_masked-scaffold_90-processed-gene-0.39-mRNA-1 protein AED:1.00 eAED:1.00 QI:0/-1/0/0/-1/1/1/0/240
MQQVEFTDREIKFAKDENISVELAVEYLKAVDLNNARLSPNQRARFARTKQFLLEEMKKYELEKEKISSITEKSKEFLFYAFYPTTAKKLYNLCFESSYGEYYAFFRFLPFIEEMTTTFEREVFFKDLKTRFLDSSYGQRPLNLSSKLSKDLLKSTDFSEKEIDDVVEVMDELIHINTMLKILSPPENHTDRENIDHYVQELMGMKMGAHNIPTILPNVVAAGNVRHYQLPDENIAEKDL